MIYSDSIKSGFRLINSRWQLVAVQAAMMLLNCMGFFVMVGIPLGIAFIIFGLDLTGLAQLKDVVGVLRNPAELLSKYFGLVLIVLSSFLLYIIMVTTIGLYIFSGSVGFIGRSILDPSLKFSLRSFFGEAKKQFFPLMWYSLFIGMIFILIAFVLGIFGGGVAAIVSAARSQDSTLALFLGIFFSLLLALISAGAILSTLAVTTYGIAVLFYKGEGSFSSFREAALFLWKHQNAFWLYVILVMGYILVSFSVMLIVYPFHFIPIIGTIISFPFQILSYVIQGYLGLVIIAVVFSYYHKNEIGTIAVEIPTAQSEAATGESSSLPEDTSSPEAPGQETAHPAQVEKAQDGPQTPPQSMS